MLSFQIEEIDKLHISITCLLAYSVFQVWPNYLRYRNHHQFLCKQTTVVNDLPKSSDSTPLLCIYINLQTSSIAFILLSQAFCLHLIDKETKVSLSYSYCNNFTSKILLAISVGKQAQSTFGKAFGSPAERNISNNSPTNQLDLWQKHGTW